MTGIFLVFDFLFQAAVIFLMVAAFLWLVVKVVGFLFDSFSS